jgi:hypothetical protein
MENPHSPTDLPLRTIYNWDIQTNGWQTSTILGFIRAGGKYLSLKYS